MNITYGSIVLRAIEETDLDFCREMINCAGIEISTVGKSFPVSAEQQLAWFRRDAGQRELRLIIDVPDQKPIGMVSLTNIDWINRTAEVGVKFVNAPHRQTQHTNDTACAFLKYVFDELNLNCLCAQVLEDNLLSRKLLLRLGFREEGRLRSRVYKRGNYHDLIVYSILKDEYTGSEARGR